MTKISIEEAQAKLPELIHELPPGEELSITEDDLAVARLVSALPTAQRKLGSLHGTVTYIAPDFDAPLDDFAGLHEVKAIIDTHALIWAVDDPARLGSQARAMVDDSSNEILVSSGSIWELAIKIGL